MRIIKRIFITLLVLALLLGATGAVWHYFLKDGSTFVMLAERFESAGRQTWAERCYRWAWSRERGNLSIPLALADSYARSGNYTKCEAVIWEAIERTPGQTELYMTLSRIYVEQDKLLDAARLEEQIKHPDAKAAFHAVRPAAPEIQPAGGEYDTDCTVSLSYQDGTAYWTLTGEYPTVAENLYTAPVCLTGQAVSVVALTVSDEGLVSETATADYIVGFVDEPVTIRDPALESLLRTTMGWTESVQLTTGLLAQVERLTLSPEVSDLSQLYLLINLRELDASALGRSADWSVLTGLNHLETLRLPPATVEPMSLRAIGCLTSLRVLSMAGCGLTSVAELRPLTALEELDLSLGSLGDISPLEGMTALRVLRLNGNALTDITPLSRLTALEELELQENPITDLTPLRPLRQMRTLNLASTGADTLSVLTNMSQLETLNLSNNAISSVSVLTMMPELTTLDISYNQITQAGALSGLKKLVRLDLSYNQLTTLPDFDDESALIFLKATNNQLQDVNGLANLPSLNYVCVDYNQITSLSPLESCLVLVQVDAFENPVRVAQQLLDSGVIIHYTPVFDTETGTDTSVEESTSETDSEPEA